MSLPRQTGEGDNSLRGFAFLEFEHVDGAVSRLFILFTATQAKACQLDSTLFDSRTVRVITRLEWAATRRRWNTLMYNPITTRRRETPAGTFLQMPMTLTSGEEPPQPDRRATKIVPGAAKHAAPKHAAPKHPLEIA